MKSIFTKTFILVFEHFDLPLPTISFAALSFPRTLFVRNKVQNGGRGLVVEVLTEVAKKLSFSSSFQRKTVYPLFRKSRNTLFQNGSLAEL